MLIDTHYSIYFAIRKIQVSGFSLDFLFLKILLLDFMPLNLIVRTEKAVRFFHAEAHQVMLVNLGFLLTSYLTPQECLLSSTCINEVLSVHFLPSNLRNEKVKYNIYIIVYSMIHSSPVVMLII